MWRGVGHNPKLVGPADSCVGATLVDCEQNSWPPRLLRGHTHTEGAVVVCCCLVDLVLQFCFQLPGLLALVLRLIAGSLGGLVSGLCLSYLLIQAGHQLRLVTNLLQGAAAKQQHEHATAQHTNP